MSMLSLACALHNAVFGLSPDSVVSLNVRSGDMYFVDVWSTSGRVSLTLDPPDYHRIIEQLSPFLADDLRSALQALPARPGMLFIDDDDSPALHIDLDDLHISARGRVKAQYWALNAALAALDPERDEALVRVLTAIRDSLQG